jgi:hypothetical protein
LERSILRAVRETKISPSPSRSWALAWTAGAVAATVILAGVFIQRASLSRPHDATRAETVAIVDAVEDLSAEVSRTLIPSAGAAAANNPLQQELGSVYADARSALNFLALNFLPPTAPTSKAESAI